MPRSARSKPASPGAASAGHRKRAACPSAISCWYAGRDSLPICRWQIVRKHRRRDRRCPPCHRQGGFRSSSPFSAQQKRGEAYASPLFWYAGRDSNPQPSEPESDALSIEPPAHLLYSLDIIAGFFPFVKRLAEKYFCPLLPLLAKSGCFLKNPVI